MLAELGRSVSTMVKSVLAIDVITQLTMPLELRRLGLLDVIILETLGDPR